MGVRARKHRGGEMNSLEFSVFVNKDIRPEELAELFGSVGWGEAAAYSMADIERSLAAYPFIAHARDREGKLVGYISAFCDGSFSAFIGELAVHPSVQRQGIGTALLAKVEAYSGDVPIRINPFAGQEAFFSKRGYRSPARPVTYLFKKRSAA